MSGILDKINIFDDIGASFAKGGLAEAALAADAFMEKYPVLGAVAKGNRVEVAITVGIKATVGE